MSGHVALKCVECEKGTDETWDGRCSECWYVYSGGDLGSDKWVSMHAVVRGATIHWTRT